jgi:hypothetical protein
MPTEGPDYRAKLYRGYEQDNDRARVHRPALGAGTRLFSYYALSRVRKYMVALDLSGDTILKPCTTTFEQAWGLPCPHLVQRLMREQQPLEIEDFDIHWQLD